ncbi:hypothetical protein [Crateriforma spongiae]|uniref:hypothetical protein n=1 Tax=Crateriforma spongiae TaxID=2724528 RepID=UPI0014477B66|nr:hypothetical protein [Crateriforma spongiae]
MTDDELDIDDCQTEFGIPHSILAHAGDYRIVELHYKCASSEQEAHLDLHLSRGSEVRRLRFLRPQQLVIEEGFPEPTHGMMIIDASGDGLDGLGVRVIDIEASHGAITFWAKDVIDLDVSDSG